MGGERDLLLARMRRGGEPDRPPGERPRDSHPLGLVVGQGRRPFLQRALDRHPLRVGAEQRQLLAREVVLGEDAVEPGEQRPRHAAEQPPAPEAAVRDPGVDQQHRHAGRVGLVEHRRPELALGPDREVGPPVPEEPLHPGHHVHRRILVDAGLRQPVGEELRRGDRDGGDEAGQLRPRLLQPPQQFDQRRRLADARGVEPGELSVRPRPPGLAGALARAARRPPCPRRAAAPAPGARRSPTAARRPGRGAAARTWAATGGASAGQSRLSRASRSAPPPAPRRSAGAGGR